MLNLIAQATQPAAWRSWGPAEWIGIIGAVSTAVCAIIAAVAAMRKSDRAERKSDRAETNSANANANASAARTSADHAGNLAAEARGMTSAVPTIVVPTPLSPPAPTPETITRAVNQPEQP